MLTKKQYLIFTVVIITNHLLLILVPPVSGAAIICVAIAKGLLFLARYLNKEFYHASKD